jgi:hypothetical protein
MACDRRRRATFIVLFYTMACRRVIDGYKKTKKIFQQMIP